MRVHVSRSPSGSRSCSRCQCSNDGRRPSPTACAQRTDVRQVVLHDTVTTTDDERRRGDTKIIRRGDSPIRLRLEPARRATTLATGRRRGPARCPTTAAAPGGEAGEDCATSRSSASATCAKDVPNDRSDQLQYVDDSVVDAKDPAVEDAHGPGSGPGLRMGAYGPLCTAQRSSTAGLLRADVGRFPRSLSRILLK
jgi:hypothetical protein